jgi:hypothetical protein
MKQDIRLEHSVEIKIKKSKKKINKSEKGVDG